MTDSNLNRCFTISNCIGHRSARFYRGCVGYEQSCHYISLTGKKKVKQVQIESETCLKLEGMAEDGVL